MAKGVKTRLAEQLDPLLGSAFDRQQWVWNSRSGPVVQVLELLGSKHGTGNLLIQWGLAPDGWTEFAFAKPEPPHYSTAQCAVSGDLGAFHGVSGWWDHSDVEAGVPTDLHHLVVSHLLPFFGTMSSLEALLQLAERGYRAYPRPRPKSPVDERGWPWVWSWPRLPAHQRFVQGWLMLLLGDRAGIARLHTAADSEWAQALLRRHEV